MSELTKECILKYLYDRNIYIALLNSNAHIARLSQVFVRARTHDTIHKYLQNNDNAESKYYEGLDMSRELFNLLIKIYKNDDKYKLLVTILGYTGGSKGKNRRKFKSEVTLKDICKKVLPLIVLAKITLRHDFIIVDINKLDSILGEIGVRDVYTDNDENLRNYVNYMCSYIVKFANNKDPNTDKVLETIKSINEKNIFNCDELSKISKFCDLLYQQGISKITYEKMGFENYGVACKAVCDMILTKIKTDLDGEFSDGYHIFEDLTYKLNVYTQNVKEDLEWKIVEKCFIVAHQIVLLKLLSGYMDFIYSSDATQIGNTLDEIYNMIETSTDGKVINENLKKYLNISETKYKNYDCDIEELYFSVNKFYTIINNNECIGQIMYWKILNKFDTQLSNFDDKCTETPIETNYYNNILVLLSDNMIFKRYNTKDSNMSYYFYIQDVSKKFSNLNKDMKVINDMMDFQRRERAALDAAVIAHLADKRAKQKAEEEKTNPPSGEEKEYIHILTELDNGVYVNIIDYPIVPAEVIVLANKIKLKFENLFKKIIHDNLVVYTNNKIACDFYICVLLLKSVLKNSLVITKELNGDHAKHYAGLYNLLPDFEHIQCYLSAQEIKKIINCDTKPPYILKDNVDPNDYKELVVINMNEINIDLENIDKTTLDDNIDKNILKYYSPS